jgi:hypothetical protein
VHCLVIRSPGVLRRTLGLFKGTAAACTLPPSCYLTLSTFTTALLTHGVFTNKTLSLYHDTSPTAPLYKTPLQPPSSQHIHLSTRHRYQLQPALSPLSRPQPPHPRHHCIAPQHTNTATMMRRSDSISSVSSMGSDVEETMHIFVKNVSGTSSKLHTRYPGFRASEPPSPQGP